ncbi:MAG: dipicolinate synthase subunit B [Christensenellales bacterium]|jgi:dipicolinate synthase subunit B
MKLEGIKIGLGITGSFCNFSETKNVISNLKAEGADVYPIISFSTRNLDTRFYKKDEYIKMLKQESKNNIIDTIQKAEPVGPKNLVDIILVCPCTGNSLAKLANGITDTPVLMAIKGHIRNNKPVVIGVSTNDGLGASLQNIAKLINTKNMYFVPFRQDDYISKPKSLVLDYNYIVDTVYGALHFKQIQPILSRI